MMLKMILIGTIASLNLLAGIPVTAIAQPAMDGMNGMPSHQAPTSQFQAVEQPLWVKLAVTTGGLGLIGLELWWFLFNPTKSRQATLQAGFQEVTVMVEGGYEPNRILVTVGQPVRLKFNRTDPNPCLEEIHLPDFGIAKALPLNQTTAIEFTPNQLGEYEFTCGMNMFRGVVQVESATGDGI